MSIDNHSKGRMIKIIISVGGDYFGASYCFLVPEDAWKNRLTLSLKDIRLTAFFG
jgi:hypothetical protein